MIYRKRNCFLENQLSFITNKRTRTLTSQQKEKQPVCHYTVKKLMKNNKFKKKNFNETYQLFLSDVTCGFARSTNHNRNLSQPQLVFVYFLHIFSAFLFRRHFYLYALPPSCWAFTFSLSSTLQLIDQRGYFIIILSISKCRTMKVHFLSFGR